MHKHQVLNSHRITAATALENLAAAANRSRDEPLSPQEFKFALSELVQYLNKRYKSTFVRVAMNRMKRLNYSRQYRLVQMIITNQYRSVVKYMDMAKIDMEMLSVYISVITFFNLYGK